MSIKSRTRQTLGPVADNRVNANAKSGLTRNSIGHIGRRKSLVSRDGATGKSSISRSSVSRSSKGRRQSSVYGGSLTVDPRPITDSEYMNTEHRVLIGYLVEKDYEHRISPRTLVSPGVNDFRNIVSFLFRQIDKSFSFRNPKSIVNEVHAMFRGLQYPFNVSKTALSAPGAPHTWPYLLACLTWLIELLGYDEDAEKARLQNKDTNNEEGGGDLVFFEYLHEAYSSFLAGDDEHYQNLEADLEGRIQEQNGAFSGEIESLAGANAILKKELELLEGQISVIPKSKLKRAGLQKDLQDLVQSCEQLEDDMKLQAEKLMHQQAELKSHEEELSTAQSDATGLRKKIDAQAISAEEAEEMAKRRLALKEKIAELEDNVMTKNSELEAINETLTAAFDALNIFCGTYNKRAADLKMIPSSAKNAGGVDLELVLDEQAEEPLSVNPKRVVKPALRRVEETYVDRTQDEKRKVIKLGNLVKEGETQICEKGEHLAVLKNESVKIEEQLKREKVAMDLCVQKGAEQTEEYELRIHKLRHEPNTQLERLKGDLQDAKAALQDAKGSIEQKRGRFAAHLEKSLNEITNHKFHFESKLNETLAGLHGRKMTLMKSD
eukprot:Stramenopile-MAST_4_protein_1923